MALVIYAVLWVGHLHNWAWLHAFDWALLNPAHDIGIKHSSWVRCWEVVSFVLGPAVLRPLGFVVAAVSLVQRNFRMALLLLVCAPLNGLITTVAKDLVGRPRPATALVYASSTSFPSGHALESMASLLALLVFVLPLLGTQALRVAAIAAAAVCVVLVGIARVALNVHHPSDVIAGWALGYVYFLVSLWIFRPQLVWSRQGDSTAAEPLLDPKV